MRAIEPVMPAIRRLLTEAWIETNASNASGPPAGVASSRRRGSKHDGPRNGHAVEGSPPHGGVDRNIISVVAVRAGLGRLLTEAWIETAPSRPPRTGRRVASSRRRGSKLRLVAVPVADAMSPPHGGVDRNAIAVRREVTRICRLLTEAWIETCPLSTSRRSATVASSRRRGSKRCEILDRVPAHGRLLTEAWIETSRQK